MLGTPSLQYSITMRIRAFFAWLSSLLFSNQSWSVLKYRYMANYEKYRAMLNSLPTIRLPMTNFSNAVKAGEYVSVAVAVIIAGILAMIATIIGANLIGPVATAVGGALNNKNLTGAANSVTAQLVLLFVVVIILIPIVFIAVFGKIVSEETA